MRGLPAASYLDPAVAPLELESVFRRSWQFVCHAADLPATGTAARLDCGGLSVFVLRGRDGELRAYRNACSHRGSRLVDGDPATGFAFVLDARVRCSYHGWCFDQHGRLESVPGDPTLATVDAAAHALEPLPVAQWRGLVFAALGEPATKLADALDALAPDWPGAHALRRLGEPRVVEQVADWKLACEHLLDPAHHDVVRSTPSADPFVPATIVGATPEALRFHGRAVDVTRAAWPARAYLELARRLGLGDAADCLFLWPNLMLARMPGVLGVVQVLPVRTGRSLVRSWRYGEPQAGREVRALRHVQERASRRALDDGRRRLERLQHGLQNFDPSRDYLLDAGTSGLGWFVERCRAAQAARGPTRPKPRRTRKSAPLAAG